jgi:hypothetical protein
LGLLWTIKKINTRNNLLEGRWWVVKEQQDLVRRKKEVISLRLNLSSERGGITG